MSFSEGMRKRRRELGLSQMDLVKRSGVPQSTISAVESGIRIPTEETMTMIANGLDCSVGSLLGEVGYIEKAADPADGGAEEKEMLRLFRQLSPEKKEYIRGVLEGLSAAHKR